MHLGKNLKVNDYNYVDWKNPIPDSPQSTCKNQARVFEQKKNTKFTLYTLNKLLCLAAPQLVVKFDLPFTSFAPNTMETLFKIETVQGKSLENFEKFRKNRLFLQLYKRLRINLHSPTFTFTRCSKGRLSIPGILRCGQN